MASDSVGKIQILPTDENKYISQEIKGVITAVLWIGKYCVIVFPELSCGGISDHTLGASTLRVRDCVSILSVEPVYVGV